MIVFMYLVSKYNTYDTYVKLRQVLMVTTLAKWSPADSHKSPYLPFFENKSSFHFEK